jgi:hypothetical protein
MDPDPNPNEYRTQADLDSFHCIIRLSLRPQCLVASLMGGGGDIPHVFTVLIFCILTAFVYVSSHMKNYCKTVRYPSSSARSHEKLMSDH